jgi:hypothetical protein
MKFIKLSNCVINKRYIIEIVKQPNMYLIHIFHTNELFRSFMRITKNSNKKDYNTIEKFIKKIK